MPISTLPLVVGLSGALILIGIGIWRLALVVRPFMLRKEIIEHRLRAIDLKKAQADATRLVAATERINALRSKAMLP